MKLKNRTLQHATLGGLKLTFASAKSYACCTLPEEVPKLLFEITAKQVGQAHHGPLTLALAQAASAKGLSREEIKALKDEVLRQHRR